MACRSRSRNYETRKGGIRRTTYADIQQPPPLKGELRNECNSKRQDRRARSHRGARFESPWRRRCGCRPSPPPAKLRRKARPRSRPPSPVAARTHTSSRPRSAPAMNLDHGQVHPAAAAGTDRPHLGRRSSRRGYHAHQFKGALPARQAVGHDERDPVAQGRSDHDHRCLRRARRGASWKPASSRRFRRKRASSWSGQPNSIISKVRSPARWSASVSRRSPTPMLGTSTAP